MDSNGKKVFSARKRKRNGALLGCGVVIDPTGNIRPADQCSERYDGASPDTNAEHGNWCETWELHDGDLALRWGWVDGRHVFTVAFRPKTITDAQRYAAHQLQDALQSLHATRIDWYEPFVWKDDPTGAFGWHLDALPELSMEEACRLIDEYGQAFARIAESFDGEHPMVRIGHDDSEGRYFIVIDYDDGDGEEQWAFSVPNVRLVGQMVVDYACHIMALKARDVQREAYAPLYAERYAEAESRDDQRLVDLGHSGFALVDKAQGSVKVSLYGLNTNGLSAFDTDLAKP